MMSGRLWYRGALIAGLFLLGLAAVGLALPVLHRFPGRWPQSWREAIVLGWNRAACRILHLHVQVTGRPDPAAGLTVANHVSWLDVIAIAAQQPYLFVAKQEVASWPVLGVLARGAGTLFVRRGDAEQSAAVSETMTWLLRRGMRLMLFPEGTTTRGDQVLRFHGKLFQSAQRAHTPVQALALRYTGGAARHAPFVGDAAFLPHLLQLLRLERIDLELHYCPSLSASLRRDQLARATRLQIKEYLFPVSRLTDVLPRTVTEW